MPNNRKMMEGSLKKKKKALKSKVAKAGGCMAA